jgi:hypothetical protein
MAKIAPDEKKKFFITLQSYLSMGASMLKGLELMNKNEKNPKRQKQWEEKLRLIREEGLEIDEAMNELGYLEPLEFLILSKSTDAQAAIKDILEAGGKAGVFGKTISALFKGPIGMLVFMSLASIGLKPKVDGVLAAVTAQSVKQGKGEPEWDIPFFLQDLQANKDFSAKLIGGLILIAIVYNVTYKKAPWVIYKIFPLKVFDDAPFMFGIMYKIHKATGRNLSQISHDMQEFVQPRALVKMFQDIEAAILANKPMFIVFTEYGYPAEIVDFIEIGELSGKLWDNMEMVVEIADNMGVAKSDAVITAYGGIAGLVKQAIMLGVFFSLFLLYFQITGAMM